MTLFRHLTIGQQFEFANGCHGTKTSYRGYQDDYGHYHLIGSIHAPVSNVGPTTHATLIPAHRRSLVDSGRAPSLPYRS